MHSAKFEEISLLVRSAEVSLFIGSGFSLKAGAPSASYLVNSLARLFPKGYKKGLRYLPLDDIASEYVKLCQGNREPLMEFLRKKMDFKRTDLSDHLALSRVPHFQNIFTTNYDTLLEDCYPETEVKIVRCNADCSISDKPVNIYKVHGDLLCQEQVVITRQDYDELLSSKRNEMVWNRVIDAFASSDIVFLGYGLNDSNVQILLKHVSETLGENRRKVFLIAPGLTEEKVAELTVCDVKYVDAYAEEFLASLTADLKDNVFSDFVSGRVPKDIALRFFDYYRIKAALEYSDGKMVVKSIDPADESVPQTINFTAKGNPDYFKNPSAFDFESLAERSNTLKVPSVKVDKDSIVSFERRINGVKVMGTDEIGTVEIGPATIAEGRMDVVASEMDFIENVDYKTYKSGNNLVLSIDTPLCDLDLIWEFVDGQFINCSVKTLYKDDYGQYEKAVSWTKFFMAMFGGQEIQFGERVKGRINPALYPGFVKKFRKSLDYYENIRKIEILRKKVFSRHDKYEEGAEDVSSMVLHLLAEDSVEEKLNMKGRIEFVANPGVEIPAVSEGNVPSDFFAIRLSQTTEQDVELNGANFGRITKLKDLTKGHIERVYEKDGKRMASIAPDEDHWVVRYVKAENEKVLLEQ